MTDNPDAAPGWPVDQYPHANENFTEVVAELDELARRIGAFAREMKELDIHVGLAAGVMERAMCVTCEMLWPCAGWALSRGPWSVADGG